jgi:hypothetical protein
MRDYERGNAEFANGLSQMRALLDGKLGDEAIGRLSNAKMNQLGKLIVKAAATVFANEGHL